MCNTLRCTEALTGLLVIVPCVIVFCSCLAFFQFLKIKIILLKGAHVYGRVMKKRFERMSRSGVTISIPTIIFSYDLVDPDLGYRLMVATQHIRKQHFAQLEKGQLVPVAYLRRMPHVAILGGEHVDYWEVGHPLEYALACAVFGLIGLVIIVALFSLLAAARLN